MTNEHLEPRRGWTLIRDREKLTAEEINHLEGCASCNAWFLTFSDLARQAGFTIQFEIPPLKTQRAKGA
jgi:predicted anti-sigma-YlaC factor YlaD